MPNAIAYLTSNISVTGSVSFSQQGPTSTVNITVNVNGIPTGFHALHINTFGDISQGRNTTGSVFNPTNGINPNGDLQTINAASGFAQENKTSTSAHVKAEVEYATSTNYKISCVLSIILKLWRGVGKCFQISLFDGQLTSIIGRAVVIYADSNPNSTAIAWGVVGRLP